MKSGTRPCPRQRALLAWATRPRADASCPFARDGVVVTAPAAADRGLPPSFRRFWASAAAANVADGVRAGALPLIGALLFATAMFVPLAVDASALVVAVILALTLPKAASTVAAPPAREERPRLLTELLGGARRLLGHPRLAVVTCAASTIAFADAAWWSVLVVYSGSVLGLPEAGFGLLPAAGVVGGTAGAACAARLAGRFPPHLVLTFSALLCGLPAVAVAASGTTAVTAVWPSSSTGPGGPAPEPPTPCAAPPSAVTPSATRPPCRPGWTGRRSPGRGSRSRCSR
ncbi:hypothetical protein GA0115237_105882 [Streptomyces sp. ScaeMP-6W]|nr:hypothetical protein GA0115237_105882 [Streptomyces sp. ScaeMP-6W]